MKREVVEGDKFVHAEKALARVATKALRARKIEDLPATAEIAIPTIVQTTEDPVTQPAAASCSLESRVRRDVYRS
jgi:hypothetical protein